MTTTKRHRWHAWYDVFLACIREGADVTEAARLAEVTRDNAYQHARTHPPFDAAWKAAERTHRARIQSAARAARKSIHSV